MMTWRYRVVRVPERYGYWYSIREVYTEPEGLSWNEKDSRPGGETLDELRADLAMMADALALPVMEEADGTLVETEERVTIKRRNHWWIIEFLDGDPFPCGEFDAVYLYQTRKDAETVRRSFCSAVRRATRVRKVVLQ